MLHDWQGMNVGGDVKLQCKTCGAWCQGSGHWLAQCPGVRQADVRVTQTDRVLIVEKVFRKADASLAPAPEPQ